MQSQPDGAFGSDSDLVTGPDPNLATFSVLNSASQSLPVVTTRSFSDLAKLSVLDLEFRPKPDMVSPSVSNRAS